MSISHSNLQMLEKPVSSSLYIHTQTFFPFLRRGSGFFFKAALPRSQSFFHSDMMALEALMFPKEHNTKLSTSVNGTTQFQCRLCELLADSSVHKLLTLLLKAYGVFLSRYITTGELFLALP